MIRIKISNFIKKHKDKIQNLFKKLIIVAVVVFTATIILSLIGDDNNNNNADKDVVNVYKPTQTIIQGSDISQEQYEEDYNLVNKFIEYCNNKQVEEAYSLISDECKQEAYPTIERFKENYYNYIFNQRRTCNLQSWISTSTFTVYKVRYTNNMLATGFYDENDVYEDYLTLNKKRNIEKISIGNFVDSEECEVTTKTNEFEATVTKKKTYLKYEEYEIEIKNNTLKTLLLDNLNSNKTIKLITTAGTIYKADTNGFLIEDLVIKSMEVKKIKIRFIKSLGATENISQRIEFVNIIKDYNSYINNREEYTDTTNITIELEG